MYVVTYVCMYLCEERWMDVFIYHPENVYHGDRMAIGWMKKKAMIGFFTKHHSTKMY